MEAIFHYYWITRLVHVASSSNSVSKKQRISNNNIIAFMSMQENGHLWHVVCHELQYQVVQRVIWILIWNVPWG